mgnify:CR=1 FL=1
MFQKPNDDNFNDFFTAANFLSYSNACQVVRAANTTVGNAASPKNSAAITSGTYSDVQITDSDAYYNNYDDEYGGSTTYGCSSGLLQSANGPELWRPARSEYWCEYATNWIRIKNRWDLSVTSAEWSALLEMLETCGASSPLVIPSTATPLGVPATPTITVTSGQTGLRTGLPLLYDPLGPDRDCGDFPTWAHAQDFYEAAGGNNAHGLDRDRDGIACQSLPGAP